MPARVGLQLLDRTITARLSEEDHQRLLAAARARGVKPNTLTRIAVINYLDQLESKASSAEAPAA